MLGPFNPGDVVIHQLTIHGPRGILDLTNAFISADIYESIHAPTIFMTVDVLDLDDAVGELILTGDETVTLSFSKPNEQIATYSLNLNAIIDSKTQTSMKYKTYTLQGTSKEVLNAKKSHVQKAWNTTVSNMMSDVYNNFIKETMPLFVEASKGVQKYIAPNIKPEQLVEIFKKRASANENKSSSYLFFANRDGYHFVTLESLFRGGAVKNLIQYDTVGHNDSLVDHNIISYNIPKQVRASQKLDHGALNHKVTTFDMETLKYENKTTKPKETDYKFGGSGSTTSGSFLSKFGNAAGQITNLFVDKRLPETGISRKIPHLNAYATQAGQNYIRLLVYGDPVFKAGKLINAYVPKKVNTTGPRQPEPLISGDFLIYQLRHMINMPSERPRYLCSMECSKGLYENGV